MVKKKDKKTTLYLLHIQLIHTRRSVFVKLHSSRDGPIQKYRNKAEMETFKKLRLLYHGTLVENKGKKATLYLLYMQ